MPDEPQICPVCGAELDAERRFGPGFLVDGEPAFATSCAKCLSVALSFAGSFEDGFGAPLLKPRPWIAAAIAMRTLEKLREAEQRGRLPEAVREIALDRERRLLLRTPEVLPLARVCYEPGSIVTPATPLAFGLERDAGSGAWRPTRGDLTLGELHPDTMRQLGVQAPSPDEPEVRIGSGWALLATTARLETIAFDESYALHVTARLLPEQSKWVREGALGLLRAPLHLLAPAFD